MRILLVMGLWMGSVSSANAVAVISMPHGATRLAWNHLLPVVERRQSIFPATRLATEVKRAIRRAA